MFDQIFILLCTSSAIDMQQTWEVKYDQMICTNKCYEYDTNRYLEIGKCIWFKVVSDSY